MWVLFDLREVSMSMWFLLNVNSVTILRTRLLNLIKTHKIHAYDCAKQNAILRTEANAPR